MSLGIGLVAGSAGAVGGPPIDLTPGTDGVRAALLTDDAVWTLSLDPNGSRQESVLFTRSLSEDATSVTLGRSTRVARASGYGMAEHEGTIAYLRRADGALVLRAPDGTETVPAWGKTSEFTGGGLTSLSSTWVAAGSTVVDRRTGTAYALLESVVDVPAGSVDTWAGNAFVTEDRAVFAVGANWDWMGDSTAYIYTVALGTDGPVGPALRLDETSELYHWLAPVGFVGSHMVWTHTGAVYDAATGAWEIDLTASMVPTASPAAVATERAFGPQAGRPKVMAAGDTVVAQLDDPAALVWFEPADPTVDLVTYGFVSSGNESVIGVRGNLLATEENHPLAPSDGWFLDAAGRTIAADASLPVAAATFPDVSASNPFAGNISWLTDLGITRGYSDGSFRPSATVNRDAMAAFLYRLAGEPAFTPPATSPFRDVPTSHAFYTEISWLADAGISTGSVTATGAYYKPSDPVSREAMAAFLHRFAGEPNWGTPSTSPFRDVATSHPFYAAIAWMQMSGISTGTVTADGRYYKPADGVSREAMAAFMHRLHSSGQTISWHAAP